MPVVVTPYHLQAVFACLSDPDYSTPTATDMQAPVVRHRGILYSQVERITGPKLGRAVNGLQLALISALRPRFQLFPRTGLSVQGTPEVSD